MKIKPINKQMYDLYQKWHDYLSSAEWEEIKNQRLKIDNFKCVICKSKDKLYCHHLTYGRIFEEKLTDLITLCLNCHRWIHKISPPHHTPKFITYGENRFIEISKEEIWKKMDEILSKCEGFDK